MDFEFNDDQRLIADSVAKWTAQDYGFERRQTIAESEAGRSPQVWGELAGIGLLGLPFAQEDGGFGGGPVETMIVMEAMGRALVTEPWLHAVVFTGALLRHGASAAQRAALTPAIVAGERIVVPAWLEPQSRWDAGDVATRAAPAGAGWRIDGMKTLVAHGATADAFIVSARTGAASGQGDGIGLFLVPREAPGVSVVERGAQDGGRLADVAFANVAAEALGGPGQGLPALEQAIDAALAAICAEAVGAMDEALAMTVAYLKTRVQFGQPIGSFQALQHRAADMYVALEQARSMALLAAMSVEEADPAVRRAALAAAKAQIGKCGRFVGEQAIQLHGGIAMTWEYKVGHLFKRLAMIDKEFGDRDHHLDWLAAGPGLIAAA